MQVVVPSEVAIALGTDRVEFLEMCKSRVEKGETLPPEQCAGLIQLIIDMMQQRLDERRKYREFRQWIEGLKGYGTGLRRTAEKALDVIDGIDRSDYVDEDDD